MADKKKSRAASFQPVPLSGGVGCVRGRLTVNAAPPWGFLLTVSVPPKPVTIWRLMANPSPAPARPATPRRANLTKTARVTVLVLLFPTVHRYGLHERPVLIGISEHSQFSNF